MNVSECSCGVVFVFLKLLEFTAIMEDSGLFSLEDDDAHELFITQTPWENLFSHLELSQNNNESGFFGDGTNFQSPCAFLVNAVTEQGPIYEDILDDDNAFENSKNEAMSE